jgi:phosphoribosyl-ATP pyrophosphohydrolase/phosphoribosyl-AMP cyclohydrolase
VGGGIRSAKDAAELVSLGADKVIIGSAALRLGDGSFGLNTGFLESLAKKIGRERVIVALDARNERICVDGWKTDTGLLLYPLAKNLEKYAGGILFTCVEREGGMEGIDLGQVKRLREAAGDIRITVAGGVNSLEQIRAISALGCDIQLGMALYTGKIDLAEAFDASLDWGKGLLPVVVQDEAGQVQMLGFTDSEALLETFKRGTMCFHSRAHNKLWMKGETSGNTLKLLRLRADCDSDTILASVRAGTPACHTGAYSCFETGRRFSAGLLQEVLRERLANPRPGSYTATLDDELVREKVREEAEELCEAKTHEERVWEAADLLYFSMVLLSREGVGVQEVLAELDRRHKG